MVRVRITAGEVSGRVQSFDGTRLVLENRGCYNSRTVAVDSREIVQIKPGRGFAGSIRHAFSRTGCVVASPVADFVISYQMLKYFNEAP